MFWNKSKDTDSNSNEEASQGWLARLAGGLKKTRTSFTDSVRNLFSSDSTNDFSDKIDELEEILIKADVGVEATSEIVEEVRARAEALEKPVTGDEIVLWLKELVSKRVARNYEPLNLENVPYSVLLIVGVNGVGKTTTIAKLASIFAAYGKKIMLVAGDTFRAGAIEQLSIWADRAGVEIVKGKAGSDPSAVVFEALSKAKVQKTDLVIIDTAGRLHTQVNLMEELKKIKRVIQKHSPNAPHETFLILDATTGQNAINQAQVFSNDIELSGLCMTKLDGTAKGGIIINICHKLNIPLRFIGVGEQMGDLRPFKAEDFVNALFDI
jgi:fused signal recognition particle receptor